MKSFTVKEDCNLKDFADFTYPQGSFCLAALLRSRDIKVNGERVGKNVNLKRGDIVTFYTTPRQENLKSHEIVYEDENILIADKYSGVTSEALLSELCERGEFYAVHRLDRNTGGLLAFAKTKAAESEMLSAFKERRVNKTYLALCKNAFKDESATLTAYLKKDEKNSLVKIYGAKADGTVKIITEYRVEERRGDIALVRILLHTGKTHQIRAHTAFIGCPVLGDEKYGDSALNKKYSARRQCLVAKTLSFSFSDGLEYLNSKQFESGFSPERLNKN